MFCCGVCNAVFTGIHPETVLTTPCGHLFHDECLSMCFNKVNLEVENRCPFCSSHIITSKIIKIHLQICANWKDTAAALKKQANTSIINLDESVMMENCKDLNNSSIDEIEDDSVLGLMPKLPANASVINLDESLINNSERMESCIDLKSHRKTMLTTSLSGTFLTKVVESFLSILNRVIQNSIIQARSFMSEKKLIESARETGYSNLIIITMSSGYPVGICFIDLKQNLRLNASVASYKCFNDTNSISMSTYSTTKNKQKLNVLQEFVFNFFSQPGNLCNVNTILFPCHDNCTDMKFIHNLDNLMISFIIKLPNSYYNHKYIRAIN